MFPATWVTKFVTRITTTYGKCCGHNPRLLISFNGKSNNLYKLSLSPMIYWRLLISNVPLPNNSCGWPIIRWLNKSHMSSLSCGVSLATGTAQVVSYGSYSWSPHWLNQSLRACPRVLRTNHPTIFIAIAAIATGKLPVLGGAQILGPINLLVTGHVSLIVTYWPPSTAINH